MAELNQVRGLSAIGSSGLDLVWAEADMPAEGQNASGDRHFVNATDAGVLVAVLDALGHGEEASTVAEMMLQELDSQPVPSLADLLAQCDRRLQGTRGAVGCLVWFDQAGWLSWLAAGNISAIVWRPRYGWLKPQSAVRPRPGIIGMNLRPGQTEREPMRPGDVVVITTDGVGGDLHRSVAQSGPPEAIARRLIENHRNALDDALAFVARCEPARS